MLSPQWANESNDGFIEKTNRQKQDKEFGSPLLSYFICMFCLHFKLDTYGQILLAVVDLQ